MEATSHVPDTNVLAKCLACFLAQPNAEVLELWWYRHPLSYCGRVANSVSRGGIFKSVFLSHRLLLVAAESSADHQPGGKEVGSRIRPIRI